MKDKYTLWSIIILGVAFSLVFLLIFCTVCFHNMFAIPELIPSRYAISLVMVLILLAVLALVYLARTITLNAKQKHLLDLQGFYIEHLNELMRVTKSQRHDFVNHFQVVYALMKTEKNDRAQEYIEDLCCRYRIADEMLQLSATELSALLLAKKGLANDKKIFLKIITDSDLEGLSVEPYDLITVVGNLLDNAFDAVEGFPKEKRNVEFKIFQTPKHFAFQTSNPGYIPKELQGSIFKLGFSTKNGENHGIGLASVKSTIEKNKGEIIISSNEEKGTKITALFPVEAE